METTQKKQSLPSHMSELLSQLANTDLRNEDSLVNIASSSSSIKNAKRAKPLLEQLAQKLGMKNPQIVTPASSRILLNFIYTYCNSCTSDDLSVGS